VPNWLIVSVAFLTSSAVALAAVGMLLPKLRAWQVMDVPNARSLHTKVTPRGGGLGVLLTVLPGWLLVWWFTDQLIPNAAVVAAAALLAAVCWIDDVRTIGPAVRFGVQVIVVLVGLSALTETQFVFAGYLPWFADRLLAALCWLWFINLFNFMDGIDGLAATETIAVCLGVALLAFFGPAAPVFAVEAIIVTGAALGFLWWNWSPAKVFLGDVGSAPIGFLVGFLLIKLAISGYLIAALVLPLYFVADATATLFRRLRRGAKVWEAHREHAYQKAAQAGMTHRRIVGVVALANLSLIGLAWLSMHQALIAAIAAMLVVVGLLRYLSTRAERQVS